MVCQPNVFCSLTRIKNNVEDWHPKVDGHCHQQLQSICISLGMTLSTEDFPNHWISFPFGESKWTSVNVDSLLAYLIDKIIIDVPLSI